MSKGRENLGSRKRGPRPPPRPQADPGYVCSPNLIIKGPLPFSKMSQFEDELHFDITISSASLYPNDSSSVSHWGSFVTWGLQHYGHHPYLK